MLTSSVTFHENQRRLKIERKVLDLPEIRNLGEKLPGVGVRGREPRRKRASGFNWVCWVWGTQEPRRKRVSGFIWICWVGTPAIGAMKLKIISVVLWNLLSKKKRKKKVYLVLLKTVEAVGSKNGKEADLKKYITCENYPSLHKGAMDRRFSILTHF